MLIEMSNLFKVIDVWSRRHGGVIRYRCFQLFPSGRFCVQSADFYNLPPAANRSEYLDRQFEQLLLEQSPDERAGAFSALEEAIAQHELDFADRWYPLG
jgi:hypothetical protein